MSLQRKFSCVVVGQGNLTLCCVKILYENGFEIKAVVTNHNVLAKWCDEFAVLCIEPHINYEEKLINFDFDYLFCIINASKLSNTLVNQPALFSINYHDSLLPKYAGVHAASWAILSGEKKHGITWHLMNDKIDDGDIILQKEIAVSENESSLTINLKCFEAAINSLSELVAMLIDPPFDMIKQHKVARKFYYKSDKPKNNGIIDKSTSLLDCSRLINAAFFGHIDNDFYTAKIKFGCKYYVILEAHCEFVEHDDDIGSVKYIFENKVDIALDGGYLHLFKIGDEYGVVAFESLMNQKILFSNALPLSYMKTVVENHQNESTLIALSNNYHIANTSKISLQDYSQIHTMLYSAKVNIDQFLFVAIMAKFFADEMQEEKILVPVVPEEPYLFEHMESNLFLYHTIVYVDMAVFSEIDELSSNIRQQLLNPPVIQSDIRWRYKKLNRLIVDPDVLVNLNPGSQSGRKLIFSYDKMNIQISAPSCFGYDSEINNIAEKFDAFLRTF